MSDKQPLRWHLLNNFYLFSKVHFMNQIKVHKLTLALGHFNNLITLNITSTCGFCGKVWPQFKVSIKASKILKQLLQSILMHLSFFIYLSISLSIYYLYLYLWWLFVFTLRFFTSSVFAFIDSLCTTILFYNV